MISEIEKVLEYHFLNPQLLYSALTHRSHFHEVGDYPHNERMEFLGDSILNMLVGERLMKQFPEASEGELSKYRAELVSEEGLLKIAKDLGLGQWLRLGRGEELQGGRERSSLLADAVEALLAAVYLDSGGLREVRRVLNKLFESRWESLGTNANKDLKSQLQEWCQKAGIGIPTYRFDSSTELGFLMVLEIQGSVCARAVGFTKKEATQKAARLFVERFETEFPCSPTKLVDFIRALNGKVIEEGEIKEGA